MYFLIQCWPLLQIQLPFNISNSLNIETSFYFDFQSKEKKSMKYSLKKSVKFAIAFLQFIYHLLLFLFPSINHLWKGFDEFLLILNCVKKMYKRIKRLCTCNFFIINFNKNRLIYMKLEILWVGYTQSTNIAVHQSKLTNKKYKNKKHHSLGFFPGRTLIFNPPMEQAKCFSFWRYENYDNFMKQMHPHMTFCQTWATCVISINMMMRLQLHLSKEITTKQ